MNDAPAQASVEAVRNDGWQAEAEAQASALAERAGIDLLDDHGQFLSDLEQTLIEFAEWTHKRAALSPPPTVGAEDEAVAEWQARLDDVSKWEVITDPDWYRSRGCQVRALYSRPSPSAVEVKGDVIAKIRKVAADFDAYAKAYDEAGLKDLALIATAKAFGVSCALEMLCPKPVSCIASEKGASHG